MCCTENQPWKDSLKEINRQGCKQEDGLKGFRVMNQQHFFNGEVSSSRVDDSQSEVEEKRNLPKVQFSSKSCSET
jgi:hypothetical protein